MGRLGAWVLKSDEYVDEYFCDTPEITELWPNCHQVIFGNFWYYYWVFVLCCTTTWILFIRCLYFYTKEALFEKEQATKTDDEGYKEANEALEPVNTNTLN